MARDGFNINPATRIYHIVKFKDGSAYLFFSGCPWNCVYCVARTVSRWCLSISQARASGLRFGSMIGLREMLDLLQNKKVHTAFLGGEEPTYDPQLPIIMNGLKSLNINPWLITNGELLD
ncbi:MAG: radical SAM protein, partial [Nitrososphaerota archaeon]|nr:radical SAM protein [Nitrososphaerota archaeon]